MRRGFKTWAEEIAQEQRHNLGLQAESPLPAHVLADHLNATVLGIEQIPGISPETTHHLLVTDPESWSAATIVHNGKTVVIYNTVHSHRRQESDLMHELAHVICKHEPSHMVQAGSLPFALRTYDEDQEEEAAWLGGCLQLPRPALQWAIRKGMTESAMLEHFGASQALLRYRRRVTGVDVHASRLAKYRQFGRT
jgi:Zn-dependent peptidase ImmA (M78 family)